MSGVKIGGPRGPTLPPVGKAESPDRASKTFELGEEASAESAGTRALRGPLTPAQLVDQIREGELTATEAVEVLVSQALDNPMFSGATDELRGEIRQAILDMADEDPALSALARAMSS